MDTMLLLLLLSRFSRVQLCATQWTAAQQAPRSLGFSGQEHWSGLPFPSPMHESGKWSHLVLSDSSRPHGLQPTRLLRPCDFPGKSTRVGVPLPSPSFEVNKVQTLESFFRFFLYIHWGLSECFLNEWSLWVFFSLLKSNLRAENTHESYRHKRWKFACQGFCFPLDPNLAGIWSCSHIYNQAREDDGYI